MLATLLSFLLLLPKQRKAPLGEEKSKKLFTRFSLSLPAEPKVRLTVHLGTALDDGSFKNSGYKVKRN